MALDRKSKFKHNFTSDQKLYGYRFLNPQCWLIWHKASRTRLRGFAAVIWSSPLRTVWRRIKQNGGWNRKTRVARENSKMPLKCGHYRNPNHHSGTQKQTFVLCRTSTLLFLYRLCYREQIMFILGLKIHTSPNFKEKSEKRNLSAELAHSPLLFPSVTVCSDVSLYRPRLKNLIWEFPFLPKSVI